MCYSQHHIQMCSGNMLPKFNIFVVARQNETYYTLHMHSFTRYNIEAWRRNAFEILDVGFQLLQPLRFICWFCSSATPPYMQALGTTRCSSYLCLSKTTNPRIVLTTYPNVHFHCNIVPHRWHVFMELCSTFLPNESRLLHLFKEYFKSGYNDTIQMGRGQVWTYQDSRLLHLRFPKD